MSSGSDSDASRVCDFEQATSPLYNLMIYLPLDNRTGSKSGQQTLS